MKHFSRIPVLIFLLLALLIFCAGSPAEEDASLYSIRISAFSDPVPGIPFAKETTATLYHRETAVGSWMVPLFWLDEGDQPADVPRPGRIYHVVLALIIPDEYRPEGMSEESPVRVLLPDGTEASFLVISNSEKGITYITLTRFIPAPAVSHSDYETNETNETQQHIQEESPVQTDEPQDDVPQEPEPVPNIRDQFVFAKYCDDSVFQHAISLGVDSDEFQTYRNHVDWLANMVVNVIEPQAVEILLRNIPSFKAAAENDQVSRYTTFYVTHNESNGFGAMAGSANIGPNGKHYTEETVPENPQILNIAHQILVNTAAFTPETQEADQAKLEGTILHEMLHSFQYDLIRNGTLNLDRSGTRLSKESTSNELPGWFLEGTAVSVQAGYADRRQEIISIFGGTDEAYTEAIKNPDTLKGYYEKPANWGESGNITNDSNIYNMGYLASMYLYSLAATRIDPNVEIFDNTSGKTEINKTALLNGLDYIYSGLNQGRSLDNIISEISPKDDNNKPCFEGTTGFENYFMQGDDFGSKFVSDLLQFLEGNTFIEEGNIVIESGSVLPEITNGAEPFMKEGDQNPPSVYLIQNVESPEEGSSYFIYSTVDPAKTALSGGRTLDYSAVQQDGLTEEEQEARRNANTGEEPLFVDLNKSPDDPGAVVINVSSSAYIPGMQSPVLPSEKEADTDAESSTAPADAVNENTQENPVQDNPVQESTGEGQDKSADPVTESMQDPPAEDDSSQETTGENQDKPAESAAENLQDPPAEDDPSQESTGEGQDKPADPVTESPQNPPAQDNPPQESAGEGQDKPADPVTENLQDPPPQDNPPQESAGEGQDKPADPVTESTQDPPAQDNPPQESAGEGQDKPADPVTGSPQDPPAQDNPPQESAGEGQDKPAESVAGSPQDPPAQDNPPQESAGEGRSGSETTGNTAVPESSSGSAPQETPIVNGGNSDSLSEPSPKTVPESPAKEPDSLQPEVSLPSSQENIPNTP